MTNLPDIPGDEIKAFCRIMGLTQSELAGHCGIGVKNVERWVKEGAPGYWRYVLAALQAGISPWVAQPEAKVHVSDKGFRLKRGDRVRRTDGTDGIVEDTVRRGAIFIALVAWNENGGYVHRKHDELGCYLGNEPTLGFNIAYINLS